MQPFFPLGIMVLDVLPCILLDLVLFLGCDDTKWRLPNRRLQTWQRLRVWSVCARTSADSQPTKLRGVFFFWLSALFEGGEGSTSLEGGNSFSCCLIITVIRFWIWGVAVNKNKHGRDDHARFFLHTLDSLLQSLANCCIRDEVVHFLHTFYCNR